MSLQTPLSSLLEKEGINLDEIREYYFDEIRNAKIAIEQTKAMIKMMCTREKKKVYDYVVEYMEELFQHV